MGRRRSRKGPIELRVQKAGKEPQELRSRKQVAIPIAKTPRMQTKPGMIT